MSIISPSSFSDPSLIAKSSDIWGDSNFPQGCKISPDGLCVLTSTAADNMLRLYNVPHPNNSQSQSDAAAIVTTNVDANTKATSESNDSLDVSSNHNQSSQITSSSSSLQPTSWKTSLTAREGDSIRSYCWFPLMNSYHPSSCAFLASSR